MRNLRKKIYVLQKSQNPIADGALKGLLSGYQILDKAFLKRASKIDRKSEKVFSSEGRFLCVMVPKCGSRTILLGLQKASHAKGFDLSIKEKDIQEFIRGYEDTYRFAIVRDPWARAYSCYKQKIKNCSPIKQALHFTGRPNLHPDMTFSEFVHWLGSEEGQDRLADRHWASQHLILGLDLGVSYEFIGKLENMEADLNVVSKKLGFSEDTFSERRNSTMTHDQEYLSHYTPELIDLIAKRYETDIKEFGYEMPILDAIKVQ